MEPEGPGGMTVTLSAGMLMSVIGSTDDVVDVDRLERSIKMLLSSVSKVSLELEIISFDVVNSVIVLELVVVVLDVDGLGF